MKNPVGSVIVILGALLGVLGIFLPFVTVEAGGVSLSTNVFTPICIAWIVLAVGAVACAFAGQKILTLILAILAGGGFAISFFANSGEVAEVGDMASKGIGYWLLIVGAVVMALSGIIYLVTAKPKTDQD
ncbi:MAG: hypothetical protein J5819_08095 [Eubacterium sp.]|nr:hypothetical protein [Eubacterium sp.]